MPATPTLAAVPDPSPESAPAFTTIIAIHPGPAEPPWTTELRASDPAELVERTFEVAADAADLPVLAVREIVENLVHAGFQDAVVSILDGGRTLRCADRGPGIADPDRAVLPGFSSAGAPARQLIRGVGSGLPLASSAMDQVKGKLVLEPNLGGGLVVTLSAPPSRTTPSPAPAGCTDEARAILALLLEIGPAPVGRLAAELDRSISSCGRDLALLESRALVSRDPDGIRSLTDSGARVVSTLF